MKQVMSDMNNQLLDDGFIGIVTGELVVLIVWTVVNHQNGISKSVPLTGIVALILIVAIKGLIDWIRYIV